MSLENLGSSRDDKAQTAFDLVSGPVPTRSASPITGSGLEVGPACAVTADFKSQTGIAQFSRRKRFPLGRVTIRLAGGLAVERRELSRSGRHRLTFA